jgi:chromosome segregation ATPase
LTKFPTLKSPKKKKKKKKKTAMGSRDLESRLHEASIQEQSSLNLRLELERQIADSVETEATLRHATKTARAAAERDRAQLERLQRDAAKLKAQRDSLLADAARNREQAQALAAQVQELTAQVRALEARAQASEARVQASEAQAKRAREAADTYMADAQVLKESAKSEALRAREAEVVRGVLAYICSGLDFV